MSQHGCPERVGRRAKALEREASLEVLVETLTGTAFEMTVAPSDTMLHIKSKIFRVEGIPVWQQRLVLGAREVWDHELASSLPQPARLRLVVALRAGPRAARRQPAPPNAEAECGCNVTVLLLRDGQRLGMLRLPDAELDDFRDLSDLQDLQELQTMRRGTSQQLQPLHVDASEDAEEAVEAEAEAEAVEEEALKAERALERAEEEARTAARMATLRERLRALGLRRAARRAHGPSELMHKTRSEETLSAMDSALGTQTPLLPPLTRTPASLLPLPTTQECLGALSGSCAGLSVSTGALTSSSSKGASLRGGPSRKAALGPPLSRAPVCPALNVADDTPQLPPLGVAGVGGERVRRCHWCRKRLPLAGADAALALCRCGRSFCAPHRPHHTHACTHPKAPH